MHQVLDSMLSKYQINNIEDKKNAIKEIIQEIVLCGLSRGGFFKEAAFYGGTPNSKHVWRRGRRWMIFCRKRMRP